MDPLFSIRVFQEYQGIPMITKEYQGIPMITKEYQGIPMITKEYQGIPDGSTNAIRIYMGVSILCTCFFRLLFNILKAIHVWLVKGANNAPTAILPLLPPYLQGVL